MQEVHPLQYAFRQLFASGQMADTDYFACEEDAGYCIDAPEWLPTGKLANNGSLSYQPVEPRS